jgi:hypothetical protein
LDSASLLLIKVKDRTHSLPTDDRMKSDEQLSGIP